METLVGSIIGILGIGALNLIVSFSLALFVAIRARNVRSPERGLLYRAMLQRLFRQPLSFVIPIGLAHPHVKSEH
jgi:site-specific recombinase